MSRKEIKKNPSKVGITDNSNTWKSYGILVVILLISFIAYFPALNNGLLNLDDEAYIKNNPLIQSINLKEIFSRYVMGNYHPLTILIIALEYQFFGLNPAGYHAVNLFLHLLNSLLVFYTIMLLCDKANIALVATLLFGIHPLHVESVAWTSELKDLLYTLFFLASYIFYLKFIRSPKKKFYLFAILLFLLSLLSKAMAASLPVVLILTDFFKGRKIGSKALLEKIPFFLVAITVGAVAILAQRSYGAMDVYPYTFLQRILFAGFGFVSYMFKLLLPVNLSAFYPYPMLKNGAVDIPLHYYGYMVAFVVLIGGVFYSIRFSKKIFFGIGFFAITVFLVLQLLPVGDAIMADRYSYIPSIGFFYLAGEGFNFLWNNKQKVISAILLSAFSIFFIVKTHDRCKVWINDLALWNDVLEQYPTSSKAYYGRGVFYMKEKQDNRAVEDYTKAIELNPFYTMAYYNRGILYMNYKKYDRAIADYNKAIELNPAQKEAYVNRGNVLRDINRYDEALKDYEKAIELNPDLYIAYFNRGNLYTNIRDYEMALKDYDKSIELNPIYTEAYGNRGNLFRELKRYDEALKDYEKVISLAPGSYLSYMNRGILYMNENKYDKALEDYNRAIELNPNAFEAYSNRGNVYFFLKRYEEAINNYSKAIQYRSDYPVVYFYRGLAKYYSGQKENAYADLRQAASLGYQPAAEVLSGLH